MEIFLHFFLILNTNGLRSLKISERPWIPSSCSPSVKSRKLYQKLGHGFCYVFMLLYANEPGLKVTKVAIRIDLKVWHDSSLLMDSLAPVNEFP